MTGEAEYPRAEPVWVMDATVVAVHGLQVAEHGGVDGTRDEGLLASALARPIHLFAYGDETVATDLPSLATAYAFGIARNYPFFDGNKRTALVVARTFLLLNGLGVAATQEEKHRTFLALAGGSLSEEALCAWFRERAVRDSPF